MKKSWGPLGRQDEAEVTVCQPVLSPELGRQAETCLTCFCLPPSACVGRLASCLRGWQTCIQTCSWSTAQPAWTSQPPAYRQHNSEWATESSRAEPQSPAPPWESMVAALSHCGLTAAFQQYLCFLQRFWELFLPIIPLSILKDNLPSWSLSLT